MSKHRDDNSDCPLNDPETFLNPATCGMSNPQEDTYKLTDEDLASIRYFWFGKGDIERWSGWSSARPAVAREYPEIIKALEDYKTSIRTLNAVIKQAAEG